jgi:squalene-associated FAD-dependent desaturase
VGWKGLIAVTQLALSIAKLKRRPDITVAQWLQQTGQSTRLIKQLWEPLCLGALNTPIETASAQLFAEVIRLSLLQNQQAADLLIPIQPLSAVLPTPALQFLKQHGAQITLSKRVSNLNIKDQRITGVTLADGEEISAERVILATPASQTQRLLENHLEFPAVNHYPITTVYLRYANAAKLTQPMLGMSSTLAQWVFSRQDLAPGLIAVVISGPGEHERLSQQALVDVVKAELAQCFAELDETVLDSLVIREKRATFAADAGIEALRPGYHSEIENLWLCGDFCRNQLPATLEGAVLNGRSCAQQIISSLGGESPSA